MVGEPAFEARHLRENAAIPTMAVRFGSARGSAD
jgi:hypothetical protein